MNDQRKTPRRAANEVLEVADQITGVQIGRVVNISAEGLMLLGQEPIITGSVYQLELCLRTTGEDESKISFGAEAVWTMEATQPDSFWTGFRIIDISNEGVLFIDELILNWHTSEA